jgi:hypothetical protein
MVAMTSRKFGFFGNPYEPHEVRQQAWLHTPHKALGDVVPVEGCWGCSAEFRAAVEALEPGVHQFFPITIARPNGKPIARADGQPGEPGPYWVLNCLQLIDAVLPEFSSGPGLKSFPNGDVMYTKEADLCVSRAAIAGRHLWHGRKHGNFDGHYFVSDELGAALKAAKLRGFEMRPVRES